MNAAMMVVEALKASGGAADADSLKAALEGLSFEGPKGLLEIRAEDHMAIQDMYVVTLTVFDDAGLFVFAFEQLHQTHTAALCTRVKPSPMGTRLIATRSSCFSSSLNRRRSSRRE